MFLRSQNLKDFLIVFLNRERPSITLIQNKPALAAAELSTIKLES